MRNTTSLALALTLGLAVSGQALAQQKAPRPTKLTLTLGDKTSDFAMTPKEYTLEVGKVYRWTIKSSGLKEYGLVAPEFFEAIDVDEVKIGELEVKPTGLREVEFDGEGSMRIEFTPKQAGTYEFQIKQFVKQGMVGKITVK